MTILMSKSYCVLVAQILLVKSLCAEMSEYYGCCEKFVYASSSLCIASAVFLKPNISL
jgi:hypothetical protein